MSDIALEHEVYNCAFEIHVDSATMSIKFPCSYYLECRSTNGKIVMTTSKGNVPAINSLVKFDEVLQF